MRGPDPARLFAFAWRSVGRLPQPVAVAVFDAVADVAWLGRLAGARQLEANLARLRPDLSTRELRRLTRDGMRSYMRYYREAFQLPTFTREQLAARVRATGVPAVRTELESGRAVVLALAHAGNWDLAGAWATTFLGPVLTVAEKLPGGLFAEFLAFRESLGIEIVPLENHSTFRTLTRRARARAALVPLLADRDLSTRGIEVDLAGQRARVAAGPAALALTGDYALVPAVITYERLTGERRRAARSAWGIVIEFRPAIERPAGLSRADAVAPMTQAWVDVVFTRLRERPQDWHMLQKVFLADLDPERLAKAAARDAVVGPDAAAQGDS
ncbi:lipid A biosynthesis acyltransferase [Beutenbergia cavernae DSM 12333]|uniref:Lipid A biosynthesis acyltransferase n=1 Tax=Beutenbergia cavernae (strain ATCC BAA-8 / DSM 12333 / CCUG 43141 / JCM 11478 / NBRC 16432 / NCIMB 13614 / HKI 0122) TaxID=471853 RepID=C5C5P6_BEUC1|nr:phosphatidylinositol mannoside acyltransferase [Beutenbergia cavernae]ACQ80237.1 lipid A biosynthesis acyltransferase [Beutenbergia cavernae DSM 12333]